MRVFISGGAGFIGSHLAEKWIAEGAEVWILDDLSTGSMRNIDALADNPRFHYRIGSVTNEELVASLVDRADVVYHLAAAVGVKLIVEKPTHTIETNVRGAEVVLQCAAKKGKLTFIASTSEVYGKGVKLPFGEEDDLLFGSTTKSRWAYACSKAIDEYLALAYHRERDLPVIITRFFNTVGPRQVGRYGMVLPTFVRQGLAGEDITVFGSGEQRRCFGYVTEVVECLIKLAKTKSAIGQVFNIGNDHEISINGLAELVRTKTGSRSKIVHVGYDEAYPDGFEDMERRIPNVSKLVGAIGYRPSMKVEEITDRVIASMKANGE